MKKLIVINGSGTSGKDEVANISKKILKNKKIIVKTISSIEAVKDFALLFGWDGKKDDRGRKFLSDLKDAWTLYINGPFDDVIKKINGLDEKKNWLVYIHIREPDEIEKIVNHYENVTTLLMQRFGIEEFNNHADSLVGEYPYDYIIYNDGTLKDLEESVDTFLKELEIL